MFKREGQSTLQEKTDSMVAHIRASQRVKNDIRNNLLPNLRKTIKEHENSFNQNTNYNDGTFHPVNSAPFDKLMEKLTSDEHLESLNFDNILAQNNGGGTSIQDSQMDSFDGNWGDAINDNYSSCPKKQPDNRSSFRIYPNGQTSGNTYRLCAYFKNGHLSREGIYVNGKRDGLQTYYFWSKEFNFPYVQKRENYSNGIRDGLLEYYSLTKNGAVYRKSFTTYSDGLQHGDGSQWYENGNTKKDSKYFNGKIVLQHNYRRDGSFSYCTEWRADRKPRDCKTGELR
jgi:antitoxin component YwqK of YwqJK toxin-antitoxin module